MAALSTLPNEILSLITNHLERPRDVRHLSLTCRSLNEFTKADGWRAYLAGRFGITAKGSDARTSVRGITTLYRNWGRKAFLATYVKPSSGTISLNTWQKSTWTGRSGQTMGYQPSVDSYEEVRGWTDRREVLAWSAGTHIAMRVKETGPSAAAAPEGTEDQNAFDVYKHRTAWHTYQIPESNEGRDDITALRLLRPSQHNDSSEYIAFGTASGDLSLLQVDLQGRETRRHQYKTQQYGIGSLSISSNDRPRMATIQGSSLALYPIDLDLRENESLGALDEVTPAPPMAQGAPVVRPWTCNFIAQDKIAVGLGSSYKPVQIFGVTPSGLTPKPLRKFDFEPSPYNYNSPAKTSVYSIAPLCLESQAGTDAGNIFLSGAYDGCIRLHDMRSPLGFETLLSDATNNSPIYSLVTQGLQRVIAGACMHSMLKVFDLRFPGSHAYSYPSASTSLGHRTSQSAGAWNLFLHPRGHDSRPGQHRLGRRMDDSPIYSLSLPSATSPSLYAGVEGGVMNLDFLSVMDRYPDPLFSRGIQLLPDSDTPDIERSYNPSGDVLSLGMYEHPSKETDKSSIQEDLELLSLGPRKRLMVQEDVKGTAVAENARKRSDVHFAGLDERWKDPSAEGDRWSRGQIPQDRIGRQPDRGGRGRGGHRWRGGRGRGRGRGH
jgi:WD40 repeat protein